LYTARISASLSLMRLFGGCFTTESLSRYGSLHYQIFSRTLEIFFIF
jgi:hypothetical protein